MAWALQAGVLWLNMKSLRLTFAFYRLEIYMHNATLSLWLSFRGQPSSQARLPIFLRAMLLLEVPPAIRREHWVRGVVVDLRSLDMSFVGCEFG